MKMLKQRAVLVLLAVMAILSACRKDPVQPVPGPGQEPPGAEGEITPEKRLEIFKTVEGRFASLDWSNRAAAYDQLVAFLKTIPQVEAAGVTADNGNAWARFTDDELLLLVNNRKATPLSTSESGRVRGTTLAGARSGLPGSDDVLLVHSMGNYYINGKNGLGRLAEIMGGKGYQISTVAGSLERLKNARQEGIFYFSGHGGLGQRKSGEFVYGLYTTDSVTVANNRQYRQENKKGNLCYIMAYHNQDRYGKPIPETHYAITAKFVQEHMTFAENAVMYVDACGSFTDAAFVDAFRQKSGNTGLYIGWTHNVDDNFSYQASKYFFDRALGANDMYTQPEDPKQRPFDPAAVLAEMAAKGIGVYNDPERPGVVARLSSKGPGDAILLLRLSITSLQVDEAEGKLYLYGQFGDDPGPGKRSVTVHGTEVTVEEWAHGLITCKIPSSGPGSAGDVVVKAGQHESNVRRLTEWRGELKFTHPAEGSILRTVLFDVHLRADVHSFRTAPGQTPKPYSQALNLVPVNSFARDCSAFYTLSGTGSSTYDDGCPSGVKVVWHDAQGTIPWTPPGVDNTQWDRHFATEVKLQPGGFKVKLDVGVTRASTYEQTNTSCGNPATMTFPLHLNALPSAFREFTLAFDNNLNIKADKKEIRLRGEAGMVYNAGQEAMFPVTLQWRAMQASYPPLPTSSARMGVQ